MKQEICKFLKWKKVNLGIVISYLTCLRHDMKGKTTCHYKKLSHKIA